MELEILQLLSSNMILVAKVYWSGKKKKSNDNESDQPNLKRYTIKISNQVKSKIKKINCTKFASALTAI